VKEKNYNEIFKISYRRAYQKPSLLSRRLQ
jgi:hypothetical protein